jgi:hypothetical protein
MSRQSSRVDFEGILGAGVLASTGSIVIVIGIGRFAIDVIVFFIYLKGLLLPII